MFCVVDSVMISMLFGYTQSDPFLLQGNPNASRLRRSVLASFVCKTGDVMTFDIQPQFQNSWDAV